MDLGALMASGYVESESPSHRRKDLRAFFRGRVLMSLCGTEDAREKNLLQRCKSEGPHELASEFVSIVSTTPDTAMAHVGTSRMPSRQADSCAAEFPQISALRPQPATQNPNTDLLLEVTRTMQADESQGSVAARICPELDLHEESGCLSGGSSVFPSSFPLPRTRAKPLSVPPVAGATRWHHTENGCLVEVPVDPQRHAQRQAEVAEVRRKRETPKAQRRDLFRKQPLTQYGDQLVITKPPVPKQRRRTLQVEIQEEEEAVADDTPKYQDNKIKLGEDMMANIRLGVGDWWLKDDKDHWNRFMEEESHLEHMKEELSRCGTPTRDRDNISPRSPLAKKAEPRRAAFLHSKSGHLDSPSSLEERLRQHAGGSRKICQGHSAASNDHESDSSHLAHHATPDSPGAKSSPSSPSRKSIAVRALTVKEAKRIQAEKAEFRHLVNLSRIYQVQLDDLRDTRERFHSIAFDTDQTGERRDRRITQEGFRSLVREFCHVPEDQPIPFHLTNALPHLRQETDPKKHNLVCFDEFLLWTLTCAYTEDYMVASPADRHIRQLARDHKMQLIDVERIKSTFDLFDTDKSNQIERSEFRGLLCKLMKIKNENDISESRLHRYWRELDEDCSGEITFDEFLLWYTKSFNPNAPVM